jgi:hypothetical protein
MLGLCVKMHDLAFLLVPLCSTLPTTMRLDEGEHVAGRWLDVKQAAEELGISSDAVRKRIARETLRSAKDEDGTVRVWLDGTDDQRDGDQPIGWTETGRRLDDLLDVKDAALQDLRDQLEHMRRESERKDAIIMQMAQANATLAARVPELEAAREAREGDLTASEEPGGVRGRPVSPEQEQRHSWLYRFFFGP